MTAPIKVTVRDIEALSERLQSATRSMNDCLETLDGEIATLQGAWSGEALEAYTQAQRAWRLLIEDMKETLAALSREASSTAVNYQDTSRAVGNVWGR